MIIPTRENSAVLFLDLQEEIVKNSKTLSIERLRKQRARSLNSSLYINCLFSYLPFPKETLF
jgi:hypothetical protein